MRNGLKIIKKMFVYICAHTDLKVVIYIYIEYLFSYLVNFTSSAVRRLMRFCVCIFFF